MVESPLPEFCSILDCLSEQDIKKIARNEAGRNFDRILSLFSGNHDDFNSVIEKFYERFSKYSDGLPSGIQSQEERSSGYRFNTPME